MFVIKTIEQLTLKTSNLEPEFAVSNVQTIIATLSKDKQIHDAHMQTFARLLGPATKG